MRKYKNLGSRRQQTSIISILHKYPISNSTTVTAVSWDNSWLADNTSHPNLVSVSFQLILLPRNLKHDGDTITNLQSYTQLRARSEPHRDFKMQDFWKGLRHFASKSLEAFCFLYIYIFPIVSNTYYCKIARSSAGSVCLLYRAMQCYTI